MLKNNKLISASRIISEIAAICRLLVCDFSHKRWYINHIIVLHISLYYSCSSKKSSFPEFAAMKTSFGKFCSKTYMAYNFSHLLHGNFFGWERNFSLLIEQFFFYKFFLLQAAVAKNFYKLIIRLTLKPLFFHTRY